MTNGTYNICIPIFNEAENVEKLIERIKNFIYNLENKNNFNIVFYDDGSTDNTVDILKKYEDITLIEGKENRGLGHAVKNLIDFSIEKNVDGIFKVDGDNQMEISEINNFINYEKFEESDVIYGNRFNSNLNYSMPKFRRLGSLFFKYILRIFSIKINDPTNGFIYLSKKYMDHYKIIGSYNVAQQILLDAKLRNLNINEIDITITSRSVGKSFIGIKYPIIVISNLIALLVYRRTVRYLISPGLIIFIGGIVLLIINVTNWILGYKDTIISDDILILMIIVGIQLSITGFLLEIYKNQSRK
tara:strand:+ start:5673 stop:6578 length:906 start_codon:yes stop_codon:yes gene_type:complete